MKNAIRITAADGYGLVGHVAGRRRRRAGAGHQRGHRRAASGTTRGSAPGPALPGRHRAHLGLPGHRRVAPASPARLPRHHERLGPARLSKACSASPTPTSDRPPPRRHRSQRRRPDPRAAREQRAAFPRRHRRQPVRLVASLAGAPQVGLRCPLARPHARPHPHAGLLPRLAGHRRRSPARGRPRVGPLVPQPRLLPRPRRRPEGYARLGVPMLSFSSPTTPSPPAPPSTRCTRST